MAEPKKIIPILMFSALPAAGKSESRRYLKSLPKEKLEELHLGDTSTQIDDYPYVHAMYDIDDLAVKHFGHAIFKDPIERTFYNSFEWGMLTDMINDDYFDIKKGDSKIPEEYLKDPVEWLFHRYDVSAVKTGKLPSRFFNLHQKVGDEKWNAFKKDCHDFCATLLKEKYENIPNSIEGKTIVFEFSRGGTKGESFPLKPPFGYQYSLQWFDKEILENAHILYIWVTPEMSLSKNVQRAKEGEEGKSQTVSTQLSLTHGVEYNVMIKEYGCDDIDYLLNLSPNKNYLPVKKDDVEYHVRCGRLDNREDLTSCFRKPQNEWTKEEIDKMAAAMKVAFDALLAKH